MSFEKKKQKEHSSNLMFIRVHSRDICSVLRCYLEEPAWGHGVLLPERSNEGDATLPDGFQAICYLSPEALSVCWFWAQGNDSGFGLPRIPGLFADRFDGSLQHRCFGIHLAWPEKPSSLWAARNAATTSAWSLSALREKKNFKTQSKNLWIIDLKDMQSLSALCLKPRKLWL